MEFVKIKDPNKRGDYLVVAQGDYDPEKHRLFEGPEDDPEDEPTAEESGSRRKRR